ncbi:hypothetical protein B0H14DRAFT_3125363 [Mycena olivaceomarginata]|nr:hypothetical protein B0H14DRAFT_3125363 [Mycena olivaceomarginata]
MRVASLDDDMETWERQESLSGACEVCNGDEERAQDWMWPSCHVDVAVARRGWKRAGSIAKRASVSTACIHALASLEEQTSQREGVVPTAAGSMSQSSLPVFSFLVRWTSGRSGGAAAEDMHNRTGVDVVIGYAGLSGHEAADEGRGAGPARDGPG